MSKWKEYKLGEFLKVKHGFAFKGEFITTDKTQNILVTPGNFHIGGGFKDDKYKYYNNENFPSEYILKGGDIIVTMTDLSKDSDTLGYSAKIPFSENLRFLHNQRVGLVQFTSDKVCPDFVYWIMRTREYQSYIVGSASGTSIMHTSPSRIENYSCYFPSLDEQKRIACILSSLDDKIDLLNRENATLEAMAETFFRQWFIEEAKEDWEEGKLGDILSVKGGTTPSTKEPNFWDGNIAWTSPRDVTTLNGLYLFKTEKTITEAGLARISSGLLPKGTLLMSSRAPVGVLAFAEIPLAINQGYIAILDDKGYAKEFIYLWLKANMDLVHSYSNGSTFMEISKSAFKSLDILIPPKIEVNNFIETIKPYFEKIKLNEQQIRLITQKRDILLPKLMSNE
jgi:type I restriction enzyme S subunit